MMISLMLSEEEDAALTFLAEQQGMCKNEVVLQALREDIQRMCHETEVLLAAERALDRWDVVLEKFGK